MDYDKFDAELASIRGDLERIAVDLERARKDELAKAHTEVRRLDSPSWLASQLAAALIGVGVTIAFLRDTLPADTHPISASFLAFTTTMAVVLLFGAIANNVHHKFYKGNK